MTDRFDETWQRLLLWTAGQAPSERLAGQVVLDDGYRSLDPSHPLGGPDGGKDAQAQRDGRRWIMGVYFPRGQQTHRAIRDKLIADAAGVAANDADGLIFVTNQEVALAQRTTLADAAGCPLDLFHLERVAASLDQPHMAGVREQFLGIEDPARPQLADAMVRLEGLQTGGSTFCYAMLYDFDLDRSIAHNFVVIRDGEFALHDVRLRIQDMDRNVEVLDQRWGELNAPADYVLVQWPLRDAVYYRAFFAARNGQWHQDLQLRRSVNDGCWLAATRVHGTDGRTIRHEHVDHQYRERFGTPRWRP